MKLLLDDLVCVKENIDLEEYISFRSYVKEYMVHPEWLGDFTKEDLQIMLKNNSKLWIYYLNSGPVCSMMFIPADKKSLDQFELALDVNEVADYGPMMVHPEYVGNGLQYQMLKAIDDYSIVNGYKYAVGTIHPDNVYSINNLLKDKLIGQKEFKRGVRNIYIKTLK